MHRLLVLCFCFAFLAAQAAPEVEITAEPHHHLVLENKLVRVFSVEVPPHSETLMHWHRHDYIYVTLGGSQVVNAVKDKPEATVQLGDGETRFSPATFAHIARNLTDQPFRNVTIELLDDQALRQSNHHWDEDRALNILHGGTQHILFVKDSVRVTEFELQPGAPTPIRLHTGPCLLVAISGLELRGDTPRQGSVTLHLKSGDSKWYSGGDSHTLTTTGAGSARFVTLEFP